jgi:hypothetical protein
LKTIRQFGTKISYKNLKTKSILLPYRKEGTVKILILFATLIYSISLLAIEREIVVLTSIQTPKNQPFWRSKKYQISQDIQKQFEKFFDGSGYNIIFKHQATMDTLEKALTSPRSLAVFWVSHSAKSRNLHGINFASTIQDYYGNNVKLLFQKVNPNLKFLAIAGCESKKVIEQYKKRGFYSPNLKIYSAESKIRLSQAVEQSINAAAQILDQSPKEFNQISDILEENCTNEFGEAISCFRQTIRGKEELNHLRHPVKRSLIHGLDVMIENTNQALAILKVKDTYIGLLKDNSSIQKFTIPSSLIHGKRIKLEVIYDKKENKNSKEELNLQVNSNKVKRITSLKNRHGQMFGGNHNFYYLILK